MIQLHKHFAKTLLYKLFATTQHYKLFLMTLFYKIFVMTLKHLATTIVYNFRLDSTPQKHFAITQL
jgi:hypothetical protein